MVKTGLWDGSQSLRRFKNFRTKWSKRACGTEVRACVGLKTSVPNAEYTPLGRKSERCFAKEAVLIIATQVRHALCTHRWQYRVMPKLS